MIPETPRDHAMAFIAAYETQDAGTYEQHVVRIARTWLSIMGSDHSVQGIVDRVMDEFAQPVPAEYGVAWADLREKFAAWAIAEDWLQPPDN